MMQNLTPRPGFLKRVASFDYDYITFYDLGSVECVSSSICAILVSVIYHKQNQM